MKFSKYHGAGNDFIIVNNQDKGIDESNKSGLAKKLCDRHFGVGGDGLIFAETSEIVDVKMRIFNPDGSEAEMCGNGIRCLGRYLYDTGLEGMELLVETVAGTKRMIFEEAENGELSISVEMGAVEDYTLNQELDIDGVKWEYTFLDTGVPHVVVFVNDIEKAPVKSIAPIIRRHPNFPKGANVNFVEKIDDVTFKIRTYERGVEEETFACGTGISAGGAAAVLKGYGLSDKELLFKATGGNVFITVNKTSGGEIKILMKGGADFVFNGEIPVIDTIK